MKLYIKYFFPFLIVLLTLVSVNQWTSLPVGNQFTTWTLCFILLIGFIIQKKFFYDKVNDPNLKFVYAYLLWIFICFIRGVFIAEHYWDYKNLIGSSLGLFVIYAIFVFTNPTVLQIVMHSWLKYALPLFFIFIFFIDRGASGFYLMPLSLLLLFYPSLNIKWKIIVIGLFLLVIIIGLDVRTNVIKYVITFVFSFLLSFRKILNSKLFRLTYVFFLVIPFILLFLGISNIFNIFKIEDYVKGNYETTSVIGGKQEVDDLKADSRTFLYEEVIGSAIKNDYILVGRSLARGNDSAAFGAHFAEELRTFRYERIENEVSVLNVFTWTGVIGLILYFLIFYKACHLALYKSNNSYIKIIGFYVAFRWMIAWLEDFNRFDINNLFLWITVAMCFSESFRKMTDKEFRIWFQGLFEKKKPLTRKMRNNLIFNKNI